MQLEVLDSTLTRFVDFNVDSRIYRNGFGEKIEDLILTQLIVLEQTLIEISTSDGQVSTCTVLPFARNRRTEKKRALFKRILSHCSCGLIVIQKTLHSQQ